MKHIAAAVAICVLLGRPVPSAAEPGIAFVEQDGKLQIRIDDKPFVTYVFRDDQIFRPYFAHVHAANGLQVTRNHPPIEGKDASDHATMHPGLWLAFGDLGGGDFWRNKAAVKHVAFVEKPQRIAGGGCFAVKNRYEAGAKTICEETCRITLLARPSACLLLWDSEFEGNQGFAFGDQEEMGLGIRVATPLTVKNGGSIVSSDGLRNEKAVWGKPADWCSYGGVVAGEQAGLIVMPDPRNFRRSWFHARDYGLLVANPFGRKAFTRGETSKVLVGPREPFRLRFGILVYAGQVDAAAAYRDYLREAGIKESL